MKKKNAINLEYLDWCKKTTPEGRLNWLSDAWKFAYAKKIIIKQAKS